MRITGGEWRSRHLKGPGRGVKLRPTPDGLRERAFAVIGDRIDGARVLDLFAGTGAVGLEALSRGAAEVVFVENHRAAAHLIDSNRDALGAADRSRVIRRPAARAVIDLAAAGHRFDLIWADPPFERWREGLDVLISALESALAPGGMACFECPGRADVAGALPSWTTVTRDLSGGASRVVFLARRNELPGA